jgi:hypothetical protein
VPWSPRGRIRLADTTESSWRLAAGAGLWLGSGVTVATGLRLNLAPSVLVCLILLACAGALSWTLIRRHWTGRETWVLLEQMLGTLALVGVTGWMTGQDPHRVWDAFSLGLAALLCVGRIGCHTAGCCYGPISNVGYTYPVECPAHAGASRRFPVQLVESGCWAVLLLLGAAVADADAPGTAAGVIWLGYGTARPALETLRADPRPAWRGATSGQWLGGFLAVLGVLELRHAGADAHPGWLAAASALGVALLLVRNRWSGPVALGHRGLKETIRRRWTHHQEVGDGCTLVRTPSMRLHLAPAPGPDRAWLQLTGDRTTRWSHAEAQVLSDAVSEALDLPTPPEPATLISAHRFVVLFPAEGVPVTNAPVLAERTVTPGYFQRRSGDPPEEQHHAALR